MTYYRRINPGEEALLVQFLRAAQDDPAVGRFLSLMNYRDPWKISDGWNGVTGAGFGPDNVAHTVVELAITRGNSPPSAELSVWARSAGVPPPDCGALWAFIMKECRFANVFALDARVMATNTRARAITERLLGAPWGAQPLGAWDPEAGERVDLLFFRRLFVHEVKFAGGMPVPVRA